MDINLKGSIDGIDASNKIREEYGVPTVYITGGIENDDFIRVKKSMPYGFILKPFNSNMLASVVDIALYRYSVEQKLKESEERNADILSAIPDTIFYVNRDGHLLHSGEQANAKGLWPDKVARRAVPLVKQVFNGSGSAGFEYAVKRNNKTVYIEARILSSKKDRALVVIRDISERKKTEHELRGYRENLENKVEDRTRELTEINRSYEKEINLRKESEKSLMIFSHAINQSPYLVIILTSQGEVEFVNKKYLELTGYSIEELVGQFLGNPGNPILPEPELWDKMISITSWKGDSYGLTKSGEIFYSFGTISTIYDENGSVLRYIYLAEDVTEKKRQEMELERVRNLMEKRKIEEVDVEMDWREWQEKMMNRNITRTDKSLFRNINNSFTQGAGFGALISLLEMMESTAEKSGGKYTIDGAVFDLVGSNVKIAQTAFKTFSNIDWIISNDFELDTISFREFYDFCRVVISDIDAYCHLKDQRIIINNFSAEYGNERINFNSEFMKKAFYEVLINSLKFSRKGTYITVLVTISGRYATVSVLNDPEKGEDGIVGIPSEYEKVIFEPFFRLSKLVYEQYHVLDFGLGLTLVEKIISKHGGEVFVRNILDQSDMKREPITKVNLTINIPLAIDS